MLGIVVVVQVVVMLLLLDIVVVISDCCCRRFPIALALSTIAIATVGGVMVITEVAAVVVAGWLEAVLKHLAVRFKAAAAEFVVVAVDVAG